MIKKIISIALSCLLALSIFPHSQAYAASLNDSENTITVRHINSSEYILTVNDESAIISYTVEDDITTVNVTEIETGNTYYYVRDNVNNTLYSSQTGNTISVPEISSNNNGISTFATGKYIKTITIDTYDIAAGVVSGATVVNIASFILSTAGLIGATTAAIVDILTEAGIQNAKRLYQTYKSVKLDIYETTRKTTKNGKVYTYTVKSYKNFRLVKR